MLSYYKGNNRVKMLEKTIKQYGFDDFDQEKMDKEIETLLNNLNDQGLLSFTSQDIKSPLEDSYFIMIYDPRGEHNPDEIIQEIKRQLVDDYSSNAEDSFFKTDFFNKKQNIYDLNIKIIEIFETKNIETEVNRSSKDKSNFRKTARDFINTTFDVSKPIYSLKNVDYVSFFLPVTELPDTFTIKIEDRIRSLENKNHEANLTGHVFTAKVADLMELYSTLGDSLFSKNVRIGNVKDNIDVEPAIQNTYKYNPEEFWYLNNGISLLIQSDKNIDLSIFDRIKIDTDSLKEISIINGAQTLTSLSNTSFADSEKELKKEAEKNAKVLLRVYSIGSSEKNPEEVDELGMKENQRQFIENITLSLNRQKPIIQADIAYMTNFVENIRYIHYSNDLKVVDNDFKFNFIRSGEEGSANLQEYSLGNFAKIVKSYLLGKPGEARTNAYSTLLKTKYEKVDEVEIHKLQEKSIFIEELQDNLLVNVDSNEQQNTLEIFNANYKPVNFAMDMKEKLENNLEKIMNEYIEKQDEQLNRIVRKNLESFAKYGVLLVTAIYINLENERRNENDLEIDENVENNYLQYTNKDFSNWKYTKITYSDKEDKDHVLTYDCWKKQVDNIISGYQKYINIELEPDEKILDSNQYKNDEVSKNIYILTKEIIEENNN